MVQNIDIAKVSIVTMINLKGIREIEQRLWDIHCICIIYKLFFEDYALINQGIVL